MGNQTSANQKDLLTSHPHFKHAKLIKNKDHETLRSFIPCDEETYDQWKNFLNRDIKQLQNSDFLLIPNKHTFHRQNMCAHNGKVQIDYQCYPYLLSEEISRRKQKQQHFIQGDLWFLLYALTGAKNEVEEFCGRVGDIRPENVFINQNGQIKVACLYSFPNQHSNFNKFLEKQPTFLAPEDLNLIKQGTTLNDVNKKSQLFSIGLTVLSAGLLENPSSIYDMNNSSLNIEKFKILVRKWKQSHQYTQIFRAIILDLVQLNVDDRLSVQELWGWIVKYEASIKNKEKFFIRTEHEIIEKEVARIRSNI